MRSWPEFLVASVLLLVPACDDGSADEGDAGTGTDSDGGTGETDMDEGPWASLDERPCPPDSFLTYENFGGPFMLNYCTGCHSSGVPADTRQDAPVDVNFDDIGDIREHADKIWLRATGEREGVPEVTMPPAGIPPGEESRMLGEWLACGAPVNADLGL